MKGASTTYLSFQAVCPNFLDVLGLSLTKNSNSGALFASPLIHCQGGTSNQGKKMVILVQILSPLDLYEKKRHIFPKEVEANPCPASSNTMSHLSSSWFPVPTNSASLQVGISHIRKTESKQTKAELLSLGETFQF